MTVLSQDLNQHTLLIYEAILDRNPEKVRKKPCASLIKVINAIHQGEKYCKKKGWGQMFYSKKTIAEIAGVCPKTVQRVINSPQFSLFGEKISRPYETYVYKLSEVTKALLRLFERNGLMRHFFDNFAKWKKQFLKRCKGLVRLIMCGQDIDKLLTKPRIDKSQVMNKLSTKSALICPGGAPLICPPMKSSLREEPYEAKGVLNMKRGMLDPFLDAYGSSLARCYSILRTDFCFSEEKIEVAKHYFTLNELEKAIMLMSLKGKGARL